MVRDARAACNDMTQRELAKRARVPVPHLCQIEGGLRPCGPKLADRLFKALEITDRAELLRLMAAGNKTVSDRRRKTMARLQVTMFLRSVERQLQALAGEDFHKALFLSSFSVAGASDRSKAPGVHLVLEDGTRISATLKVNKI